MFIGGYTYIVFFHHCILVAENIICNSTLFHASQEALFYMNGVCSSLHIRTLFYVILYYFCFEEVFFFSFMILILSFPGLQNIEGFRVGFWMIMICQHQHAFS